MTTDEVSEDEVFTALVKHRLSGIDPKYVPDDAVANIADAYTEWRSCFERAAAKKTLQGVAALIREAKAEALEEASLAYGSGQLSGIFLGRDDYPKAWLRARAAEYREGSET